MGNYYRRDPERVQLKPSDEDASRVKSVEISFAIPVWLSIDQQQRVAALIEEIARAPENTPRDGVHWLSGYGARPNMSDADAALLGRSRSGAPPPDGEEPSFDAEVLFFETTARPR